MLSSRVFFTQRPAASKSLRLSLCMCMNLSRHISSMFWKLTLSYLFLTLARFIFIAHRGIKLQATFSGNNAIRPTGNRFHPHHRTRPSFRVCEGGCPCVRGRVRCVRGRACACIYACVHGCVSARRSSARVRHAQSSRSLNTTRAVSCPRHNPLLP